MNKLPEPWITAAGAAESAGLYHLKIERISGWPDLTPGQRAFCMAVAGIEFIRGEAPTVLEVTKMLGAQDRETVERTLAAVAKPPFYIDEGRFQSDSMLEYGE